MFARKLHTTLTRTKTLFAFSLSKNSLYMSYRSFSNHHKDIKSFSGEYGAHWLNYAKVVNFVWCGEREKANISGRFLRTKKTRKFVRGDDKSQIRIHCTKSKMISVGRKIS